MTLPSLSNARLTTCATVLLIGLGVVRTAPRAAAPAAEHGTLTLHYVQKPIGSERYSVARVDGGVRMSADVDFTDRGGRVQLASTLVAAPDLTPREFEAKGRSYRFVNVDSAIRISGRTASVHADGSDARVDLPERFFTVDGYAPFAAQMLLVRYWLQHGRPAVLRVVPGLPTTAVIIEARGRDTMQSGGASVTAERYAIDGVVWGREAVWLDSQGAIVAATTRAGGLGFEAVRDDLEPLLGQFVGRALDDRLSELQRIAEQTAPLKAGTFALTGATIVDAVSREPIRDGTIVVRDGRIVDVGRSADVHLPPGIPTVDATGKTIVPGLWDMHTHVTQTEWLPVYLGAGVTTVRDMGNEFDFITRLRDAVAARRVLGPRLLAAGLVDGGGPNAFGVVYAQTADEARRVVAKYHDAGFQQIKIYTLVRPELVPVICEEAHRVGMTVTGHVPSGMTIDQAVDAGMDHIAHLAIRGEAGSPEVTATIAHLKSRGTVIDPTQSWNELLGHAVGAAVERFQPGILKVPIPLRRIFENAGAANIDAAEARRRVERGLRIVKALHDAGVPVVAGTDEGVPGHSVHREIELYVEAGLTPLEALEAATIVPARAMKLDKELGSIEKGKRADLAILDANPLDAIRNIRSVRWTIADGKMYDAAALWKSVRFAP